MALEPQVDARLVVGGTRRSERGHDERSREGRPPELARPPLLEQEHLVAAESLEQVPLPVRTIGPLRQEPRLGRILGSGLGGRSGWTGARRRRIGPRARGRSWRLAARRPGRRGPPREGPRSRRRDDSGSKDDARHRSSATAKPRATPAFGPVKGRRCGPVQHPCGRPIMKTSATESRRSPNDERGRVDRRAVERGGSSRRGAGPAHPG